MRRRTILILLNLFAILLLLLVATRPAERPSRRLTPWPTPLPGETLVMPPSSGTVRFAVVGDYGDYGDDAVAVADLVASWEPEFVVTTGDNNYPQGSARTIDQNIGALYGQFLEESGRFFPSLGNHDWGTAGARPYLDYFELPGNERYYDVRWDPVHLFIIDSDLREPDGVTPDSTQAQWLERALGGSDAPWKLVVLHHPPYSSGRHGSVRWLQWSYAEWGADIVMAGHDHTYERIERDGIHYLVNGLGGRSRYSFRETVPGSRLRYNDGFGAMFVEADAEQLTFRFISTDDGLVDEVTLTHDPADQH